MTGKKAAAAAEVKWKAKSSNVRQGRANINRGSDKEIRKIKLNTSKEIWHGK